MLHMLLLYWLYPLLKSATALHCYQLQGIYKTAQLTFHCTIYGNQYAFLVQ